MVHNRVEILLVEDNAADVTLFQGSMSGPYTVTVAEDGATALDRLFQRGRFSGSVRPDVVVLDLNIPLINGHEVLNAIKSNSLLRSLPVIIFSVSSNEKDVQKAYEFGASAYLIKPTDLAEMERTLLSFVNFWIKCVAYPDVMRVPVRTAEGGSSI